ncbi:hypothetical protein FOZ60_004758 [Perkinsus olseni]|uniref:Uncharacterized protein n=1 Tax=Perkinsus olseni TaxID=32597 RepID=A0A7J6NSK1_PEROL|nr:hypothetical protein FOZ60_004758 [Perkinsus olseni]
MTSRNFYGYRVGYGSEFTARFCETKDCLPRYTDVLEHVKTVWPELDGTDFSVVYYDEKGRSCNIFITGLRSLFAMAGREVRRPGGVSPILLDLTVVPEPAGSNPSHPGTSGLEEQQGDGGVQVRAPQVVPRPPRYRYQLTFDVRCFVSTWHHAIDFSLDTMREDVARVWPELAANTVQFFLCKDKAGRSWEVTEKSSMSGLFDCFAEETVRSDGHTILILKLEVRLEGTHHERASTDSVPAFAPPSLEGDHQETSVHECSDAEHSVGPASDSWILPATGEK